jgi:PPM family protein phosphatase
VQVDVEGPHAVRKGDVFVLCSDGLSGPLTDRENGAVVSALPPGEACRFLVDLANLQGGPDNITVMVVRADYDSDPAAGFQRPAARGDWQKHLPPPLVALGIGIGLALLAIVLTSAQIGGGLLTFLAAVIAVGAGLLSLLVQAREEGTRPEGEESQTAARIHRRAECGIELPLLQRIARAETVLQERIREHNWDADWATCRRHHDEAERFKGDGNLPGAFREYCRAMRSLTDALQKQRNKEEVFQPVWDKVKD